jgi:hypothetical protein
MDQGCSFFSAQYERDTRPECQAGVALPTLISTSKSTSCIQTNKEVSQGLQAVAVACCCEDHTTGGLT